MTQSEALQLDTAEDVRRASQTVQKPEILFIWYYLEWGGAQIYYLAILRLARQRGYPVRAIMPRGTTGRILDYLRQENVPVEFFPHHVDLKPARNAWHKVRRRYRDWRCYLSLIKHLRQHDLSEKILQTDFAPWSAFALLFYLALRTNIFVSLHIAQFIKPTLRDRWIKLKFQILCRLPKFHIFASNDEMRRSLRDFVPADYWQTIPIFYTSVNRREITTTLDSDFNRAELIERYSLPDNRLFVFSLANVIERKGWRVLLEAARMLSEQHPELHFVWIGTGEDGEKMEALCRERRLTDTVRIIKPLEIGDRRQDLLQLLRLADIFVLPSYAEGLSGALLEAMVLGKAVVASRINAIPEAVEEGENGLLVEAGDAAGFAAAIARLTKDAVLRQKLGENAERTVFARFTDELVAAETLDFYERCRAAARTHAARRTRSGTTR